MNLLWDLESEHWAFQMHHRCWDGLMGFYCWQRDVYVQIDDYGHFCMGQRAFSRDLRCNVKAHCADLRLVRVHVADSRTGRHHHGSH